MSSSTFADELSGKTQEKRKITKVVYTLEKRGGEACAEKSLSGKGRVLSPRGPRVTKVIRKKNKRRGPPVEDEEDEAIGTTPEHLAERRRALSSRVAEMEHVWSHSKNEAIYIHNIIKHAQLVLDNAPSSSVSVFDEVDDIIQNIYKSPRI
jgi:hypothetical protein